MHRVKHSRNQNACDICRSRRVKCRFSQGIEVCDGCLFLGTECTNVRPRRKRGPPNRHAVRAAEAGQAGSVQSPAGQTPGASRSICPTSNITSNAPASIPSNTSYSIAPDISPPQSIQPPNSPPQITSPPQTLSPNPPSQAVFSFSSSEPDILALLAPLSLIKTVLNDWFTHIHPLAPILHRKTFLARVHAHTHAHPADQPHKNKTSARLFTGLVISILAATCATLRRKSFAEYHPVTLERCKHFIITYDLLPYDGPYCLDWCIAKYNLGTAATAYGNMSDPWIWRVLGESMTGVMWLVAFRAEAMEVADQEVLKRLCCLLIVCQIAIDMIGYQPMGRLAVDTAISHSLPRPLTDRDLDPPPNPTPSSELLPRGADDDNVSYVPGLTHLLQIFLTWHTCQTDRFYYPPLQVLSTGLSRIRSTIDSLPPELRWRGGMSRPQNATRGHDIQIANIFITSLYVRSNLLQQFATKGEREREPQHEEEHHSIVNDLLEVLYHLPQPILEANGYSLIPKIRDIGAAYLEVLQGGADVVAIDDEAKGKLERLLRKLGVLDFIPDLTTA
ncbi:hypothetical protein ASPCAL10199 [Aspergillus calidoustus]|uniref:Zn(2)-C6 fungal-type domain-containing protein n=1 Tax=Aspergillus calidoustus TaxID=454130 RepID=A0A0U5CC05_ASPCI|nr:hypothetical protein ASPCAL10199 [Aspergillus calidoustus]